MTTFVFPGQGSQQLGMGSTLFSEFSDLIQKADQILGYSVADLCINNPNDQLNQTAFTQPALFIVNALSYLKLPEHQKPDWLAGHSLGEYNALWAAQVFDFETGLRLVQKRGELMSRASSGGMAAILGLSSETVSNIIQEKNLQDVSIANFNSYTQVVISGPKQKILDTQPLFERAGAKLFIPLKVSGAFHSPLMSAAKSEFTQFIKNIPFAPPITPVISNVSSEPYPSENLQIQLAEQIDRPVKWTQSIAFLLSQGEKDFVEVGPGKILSGLIKRIQMGQ